jgi:hypothetical protein
MQASVLGQAGREGNSEPCRKELESHIPTFQGKPGSTKPQPREILVLTPHSRLYSMPGVLWWQSQRPPARVVKVGHRLSIS